MNKKYLLAASLSFTLILSGCGKDKKATTPPGGDKENPAQSETVQRTTTTSFDQEAIDNLIENSDYISKVRIQAGSNSGINYNFINDYRGDLSNLEMTLPKSLNPNRDYIVFYRDGEDGKLTPSRGEESFIEIQDDRDQTLQYIEKKFPLPESVNPQEPKVKNIEEEGDSNSKKTGTSNDSSDKKSTGESKSSTKTKKSSNGDDGLKKPSSGGKPTTDLKKS